MTAPVRSGDPIIVNVPLSERGYDIAIGRGLIASLGERIAKLRPGAAVAIVSDETVAARYLAQAEAALTAAGVRSSPIIVPAGEASKSWRMLESVCEQLLAARIERGDLVVALGGGVVGDLAGFAAACYHRGVGFAQVPTTLLAQVDSAVGGKTGVNHPGGKNLIGAFHQPLLVVCDTGTLVTLPGRELRAGLAEVIKYGLICDPAFFAWLEQHLPQLLARRPEALAHVVRRSCELKAAVVGRDEREQGERALLNLGHTFGHAVEAATAYREWLHGEAVAAGLAMAATMSSECGLLSPRDAERVRRLLELAGLPTHVPSLTAPRLLAHMRADKKVLGGRLRLVLLRRIGNAFLTADYPDDALERTLQAYCG